jgi:hypothetical protein
MSGNIGRMPAKTYTSTDLRMATAVRTLATETTGILWPPTDTIQTTAIVGVPAAFQFC